MYQLPKSVVIDDMEFNIRDDGDFRMVLDCFAALADETLSEDLRVLASLLIFYNEFSGLRDLLSYDEETVGKLTENMFRFFNCGQDEAPGIKVNHTLIDWQKDEHILCAAINKITTEDIRLIPYVHWWTFMGYYMSVGESVLSTVVGIRDKIVKHKKLEKWEQEFKKSNPDYFVWHKDTVQDREAENLIKELWNQGGEL